MRLFLPLNLLNLLTNQVEDLNYATGTYESHFGGY